MFDEFETDIIDVLNPDGTLVAENLKASVQGGNFVGFNANGVLVEPGYLIVHKLSHGAKERYRVIEPNFIEGDDTFEAHYQMTVCRAELAGSHDEKSSKKKPQIDRETFNYAWEDSLIVVLRDLQWIKKPQLEILPPLFKLDGEAENALSDVVFGAKDRYFIIELKSGSTRMGDEADKPIANLLGHLKELEQNAVANSWGDGGEASLKEFLTLSRRGHFMLMPYTRYKKQVEEGNVSGYHMQIEMHPYLDVAAELINDKNYQPKEPETSFDKFLYPEPEEPPTGLETHEMIAYIEFLMKAHQSYKGTALKHPLKCVVWGNNRLFWPCIDLSNIDSLPQIFQTTLQRRNAELANKHVQKTQPLRDSLRIARENLSAFMMAAGIQARQEKRKIAQSLHSQNAADNLTSAEKHSAFKAIPGPFVLKLTTKVLSQREETISSSANKLKN